MTTTTTPPLRPRSPTSHGSTAATPTSTTLADLAQTDHRIVGVVNDSVGSSKLDAFKKAFPDRLINVGIAEQDMVGVAAGLANGGRIPFVSAASCFLTASGSLAGAGADAPGDRGDPEPAASANSCTSCVRASTLPVRPT